MTLDPATASIATGVPVRTIWRWVAQGRVIDHGDGMRVLVDPDEIAELNELRLLLNGQLPKTRNVA